MRSGPERCLRCGWRRSLAIILLMQFCAFLGARPLWSKDEATQIPTQHFSPHIAGLAMGVIGNAGCGQSCTPASPLIIQDKGRRVIRGIRIDGAQEDCISIQGGAHEVVLENIELLNCGRDGVNISDVRSVTIRNVMVRNAGGNAITIENAVDVTVTDSLFENVATGVYALSSSGVVVRNNFIKNVQGPKPRGQGVQFDKVAGSGNAVMCNLVINEPGRSRPEDAINMFRSRGTAQSPILIAGNRIIGGGPSPSGGGILVGDYGGEHIRVFQNRLVDPGQYGIAIAGGSHMELTDNKVFARRQSFTNVGLYVWKADREAQRCHSHSVTENEVSYTNAKGVANPSWNAENCGRVKGFETFNRWDAQLDPSILRESLPVCELR